VAPVPAGDAFTARQREEIVRAIDTAREGSGLTYSVFVGGLDGDTRAAARRLHAALDHSNDAVLVAVDPGGRRLEIVTGPASGKLLDDRACALAAVSMTSSFAAGDLAGGITRGVLMLGEHARHPKTLHMDTP
jgi:Domain of unknown function (DUF5130)